MEAALARIEGATTRLIDWMAGAAWRRLLVTLVVALAVALPGIAALPVTDRDEARFAQATKQMLETGDLVDIRFQEKPRWKKPAGIYWMQAGAAALAGGAQAPIWAYRVPSVLGAVLAALALGWAARPLVGPRAAALAPPMLAATILVAAEANIAKTDAMLLGLSVVALGGLARTMRPGGAPAPAGTGPAGEADARPGAGTFLAFWGAIGLAILVKGPILPVIVILALLALWAVHRRAPPLARLRPLPGIGLAALVAVPWLVAIWIVSDGAFFAESVGKDLMGKVAEGQEKHWGPPGLYLLLVWVTFWPWAALLPLALPWLWRQRREAWVALLAAWVVPFWLVLEAVPTKLPHYVLPLYPGLAIALAAWALRPDRAGPRRWQRRAAAGLVLVPPAILAAALVALPLWLEGAPAWPALPFAGVAVAAAWVAARAALAGRPLAQIGASLVAALALYPAVLQHGLARLETVFPSPRIVAAAEPWMPCASGPLVSGGYREPSLVFLAGTPTRLPGPGSVARILETEPGALVLLEDRWMKFLDEAWTDGRPDLVTRARLAYFNYNRGSMETARLLTRDAPRWAPCAGAGE